jgi:hypothetical protein
MRQVAEPQTIPVSGYWLCALLQDYDIGPQTIKAQRPTPTLTVMAVPRYDALLVLQPLAMRITQENVDHRCFQILAEIATGATIRYRI